MGNSSYPKYCAFGNLLDNLLSELGADRIHEIGLGDELSGQEDSFDTWSSNVFKVIIFIQTIFLIYFSNKHKFSSKHNRQQPKRFVLKQIILQ